MAFVKLSSVITDTTESKQYIRKNIVRMLGDVAYESAYELRRQIPSRFKLRKQWIVSGIRFKRPVGDELTASVYSLDNLMKKHEEGLNFNNQTLIQSRFLQNKGRQRDETPKGLLSRRGYFINEQGVFERKGTKLRQWYKMAFHRSYVARLQAKETIEDMASRIVYRASERFYVF